MPTLLTNAAATGTPTTWGGGAGQFEASGTFNGATVTLQRKAQDGTFGDISGTALTATGRALFQLPPGQIRASISGGPPAGVNAAAWRVRSP